MEATINLTKRKNEFGEYVVKVSENGVRHPDADYHTECYDDALGTAEDMRRRYRRRGFTVTLNL